MADTENTKSEDSQESRKITTGRDYFERVGGDVHIHSAEVSPTADEVSLREAYLTWLIRKAGYVPLAEIDPKIAAAETDSQLTLDAIYTALLTLTPEEHDRFRKGGEMPDRRKSALAQVDEYQHLVLLGSPGGGNVKQLEQEGIREFVPYLRRHLLDQGGLFLLDGLDEVPETGRPATPDCTPASAERTK